jgi:hypothetical protein
MGARQRATRPCLYGREGCAYCHTQQIRYLHSDLQRFGAPTLAWETRLDYPHLWGTRRIGPDLSRAAGTRSADGALAHLIAPRSVVTRSVMPAYPPSSMARPSPRQEARDLLACWGRSAAPAAPAPGQARARGVQCADDEMRQMAFDGPLNAHPGRPRRATCRLRPRQTSARTTALRRSLRELPWQRRASDGRRASLSRARQPGEHNTAMPVAGCCGTACTARPCRPGATPGDLAAWQRW